MSFTETWTNGASDNTEQLQFISLVASVQFSSTEVLGEFHAVGAYWSDLLAFADCQCWWFIYKSSAVQVDFQFEIIFMHKSMAISACPQSKSGFAVTSNFRYFTGFNSIYHKQNQQSVRLYFCLTSYQRRRTTKTQRVCVCAELDQHMLVFTGKCFPCTGRK